MIEKQERKEPTTARRPGRGQRVLILILAGLLAVAVVTSWGLWATRTPRARVTRERVTPEWVQSLAGAIRKGATAALALGALYAAYQAARAIYDDVHARAHQAELDRITRVDLAQQAQLANVRTIQADARGRYPLLYGVNGVIRDPNSLRAFTLDAVRETWPAIERLDAIARVVLAGGGWPAASAQGALIEAGPTSTAPAELPRMIPLTGLLAGRAPSYRRLVLGVAQGEDGQRQEVIADMADLVHVAVGGSSGWGKSVFLRSLAFQLAKSSDPVGLAMIDLEGATLAPFAACDRLLWPVGDSEQDAACILRELTQELDRRKALFSKHPGVDSLYTYNDRANGDGPLDPIVCIIDECTALLENKDVESKLRTLALRARKYGLWVVLAGQDWKGTSLDTAIRNQLSTRVQFKAMSDSQSRVLLQRSGAEEIDVKGRALAWIPGRDLVTLQAPHIGYGSILAAMDGGHGPRADMPHEEQSEHERILELAEQGLSKRQIELDVYGYAGGAATRKVGEVLAGTTTVAPGATEHDGGPTTATDGGATVVAPAAGNLCEFCGQEVGTGDACARCGVYACDQCKDGAGLCPDCSNEGV